MSDPSPPERFDVEWTMFLNELRLALPGVQLLFGFLLAAPFATNFPAMDPLVHKVYFVAFLATTSACGFFVAPSVYHRLHWRRDVRDKELMFRTCNRLAIAGVGALTVAMTSAVYVVASVLTDPPVTVLVAALCGLLFILLWFALPMARRAQSR